MKLLKGLLSKLQQEMKMKVSTQEPRIREYLRQTPATEVKQIMQYLMHSMYLPNLYICALI